MGIIEIEGMEFYAYHGHFESERKTGNKFRVDLSIETNLEKAGKSDKLEDTLNYQEAYNLVKKEMKVTSSLLENVAARILDKLIKNFPEIKSATIRISKLNPPMGGKIERVSIVRSKNGFV